MKTEAKKRKFHTAEFKTKVRHPDPVFSCRTAPNAFRIEQS